MHWILKEYQHFSTPLLHNQITIFFIFLVPFPHPINNVASANMDASGAFSPASNELRVRNTHQESHF